MAEPTSSSPRSLPAPAPDGATPLPLPPSNTPSKPTPLSSPPPPLAASAVVAVAAQAARHEPPPAGAAAPADSAGGGWYAWTGRGRGRGRSRGVDQPPRADPDSQVVDGIVRRGRRVAAVRRAAVAARAAAAVLCLAALAVLGADHHKGWALDSYYHYSQFRYCETVNVIGFLYSLFQLYAQVEHMRKGKHVIPRSEGKYFDFAMDQVLAYLLISASSSATARIGDWVVNWGSDPFPNMANGSVAISFLAFLVFAASSLISAYNLFSRDL